METKKEETKVEPKVEETKPVETKVSKPVKVVKVKAAKKAVKVAKKAVKREQHTKAERKVLLAKFKTLRKAGKSALDAAKAVDVPYITLHSWVARKAEKKASKKKIVGASKPRNRTVKAKSETASTLSCQVNGVTISGLTLNDLIAVVKAAK
jgi:hypothetical protein